MDAGDDEAEDQGSSGRVEGIPIGKHPRHNNFPTLSFLDASMCSFLLLLSFFFVFFPIVSFPNFCLFHSLLSVLFSKIASEL
jgi:hypothetical protein